MSQQTFEQFRDERLNALGMTLDTVSNQFKEDLNHEYASRKGKYVHVPVYHPSHVSITHASHVSITLFTLKSLYISHLISPTCLLLSVK
jgi:hypothetical protein